MSGLVHRVNFNCPKELFDKMTERAALQQVRLTAYLINLIQKDLGQEPLTAAQVYQVDPELLNVDLASLEVQVRALMQAVPDAALEELLVDETLDSRLA